MFHFVDFYALIQPHFDYAYTLRYPNLIKKLKDTLQVRLNKCINFCLKLQFRKHISNEYFQKLNWLSIIQRFKQYFTKQYSILFKTYGRSI